MSSIITLLTDFGSADYFVGAMKGVILYSNPEASIVDITHEIPAHDIQSGAFTLLAVYKNFPAGTIHVCVIDPGVGSSRRPILVEAGGYYFVGPDNGVFSFIYEREEDNKVFHLNRAEFFRQPVSNTFHGRDIFAPVAAAISKGAKPAEIGEEITNHVRLDAISPIATGEDELEATIIHVDRFGNCITSLRREHLSENFDANSARIIVNDREITSHRNFFGEDENAARELFTIWGSAGFLEIAAFRASASQMLKAERGQKVKVVAWKMGRGEDVKT
ncbi:MAG TPA: SAM-dependent chlorinase/fluorinase [Pyrinomonadaceae bacterium]|nr:SAM-dependent chlorinase/fluorinase [Pyrinomonadaceae bacterium]